MKVLERVIPYRSRSAEFRLYPLADPHLGARACDEPRLDRALDEIDADPNGLWLGLGDYCEFINIHDPRWSLESIPRWLCDRWHDNPKVGIATLQRDELARRIKSRKTLSRKLLAWVQGNHEEAIIRHAEVDSYIGLLEQIRPDAERKLAVGTSGLLVLRFTRMTGKDEAPSSGNTWTLTIYLHHGFGGGDLMGGTALKLEREMARFAADLYLMGHVHKVQALTLSRPITLDKELRLVQPPDALGAYCGTYLRGRVSGADTYGEAKGYRPSPASTDVVVRIRPDKGEYELVTRNSGRETAL
jgi:hypothetical protein